MRQSIVAQQIAQEFSQRPGFSSKFALDEVAAAAYEFLRQGSDEAESGASAFLLQGIYEDRRAALILAFGRANRHSRLKDIIATAQQIINWSPTPAAVAEVVKTSVSKKTVTRKKTARRTGS